MTRTTPFTSTTTSPPPGTEPRFRIRRGSGPRCQGIEVGLGLTGERRHGKLTGQLRPHSVSYSWSYVTPNLKLRCSCRIPFPHLGAASPDRRTRAVRRWPDVIIVVVVGRSAAGAVGGVHGFVPALTSFVGRARGVGQDPAGRRGRPPGGGPVRRRGMASRACRGAGSGAGGLCSGGGAGGAAAADGARRGGTGAGAGRAAGAAGAG